MADRRRLLAAAGEDAAAAYLRGQGWTVLARNFRTRFGELDLIADDGCALVFVEVKARRSLAAGLPQEAVHADKRRRVRRMAQAYLAAAPPSLRARPARFDVIAVRLDAGPPQIEHLRDAF